MGRAVSAGAEFGAPAILVLSARSLEVAARIRAAVGGDLLGLEGRVEAERSFRDTGETLRALFARNRPLIGVFAAGILIRCLAPVLGDKRAEPPVVAVAPDGSAVVPLLGGLTGAEPLAACIAAALGVVAASTAAGAAAQRASAAPAPCRAEAMPGRGTLAVLGLGPGDPAWLTPEARQALDSATDIVGYATYLNRCAPRPGQRLHASDNRAELARARQALGLAREGRAVALVSSGDPGIFAMASALMEVVEAEDAVLPEIRIVPGISAMQAAAARVGAPLGHDFAVISLSDIRKPWDVIEARLNSAAESDFVIALYNPASTARREQIARAKALLLEHRPDGTPVVVARDVGRTDEYVSVTTLGALDVEAVDMRTLLIVGSSRTRRFETPDGRVFVYTPRSHEFADAR